MNLNAGAWDFVFDGAEDTDGEVVRLLERLVGSDFEVEVDELVRAGATRTQVVESEDAFGAEAFDDRSDLCVYRSREPPVHQHVDRLARYVYRRPEDEARNQKRDERVGERPAGERDEEQRAERGAVRVNVGRVVDGVGVEGGRVGLARDLAEARDEREADAARDGHRADAEPFGSGRLRSDDAADGFPEQYEPGGGDDEGLEETGERLGLAVTITMVFVGRGRGGAHGVIVDRRREDVHRRVEQRSPHADRTRHHSRQSLQGDEEGGGPDGETRGRSFQFRLRSGCTRGL